MIFWWLYPLGGGGSGTTSASTSTSTSGSTVTVGPPVLPSDLSCAWLTADAPTVHWQRQYAEVSTCGGVVDYTSIQPLAFDSFQGAATLPLAGRTWLSGKGVQWGTPYTGLSSASTVSFGYIGLSGTGAAVGVAGTVRFGNAGAVLAQPSFQTTDNFEVWMDGGFSVYSTGDISGPALIFWSPDSSFDTGAVQGMFFAPLSDQTFELYGLWAPGGSGFGYELPVPSTPGQLMRLGVQVSGGTITPWMAPYGGGSRSSFSAFHWSDLTTVNPSQSTAGYVGFYMTEDEGVGVGYFQFGVIAPCG